MAGDLEGMNVPPIGQVIKECGCQNEEKAPWCFGSIQQGLCWNNNTGEPWQARATNFRKPVIQASCLRDLASLRRSKMRLVALLDGHVLYHNARPDGLCPVVIGFCPLLVTIERRCVPQKKCR